MFLCIDKMKIIETNLKLCRNHKIFLINISFNKFGDLQLYDLISIGLVIRYFISV